MPCQHKGCPQTFTTKAARGPTVAYHMMVSCVSIEIEAMRLHYRVAHLNLKEYLCRTPAAPPPFLACAFTLRAFAFAFEGNAGRPSRTSKCCGDTARRPWADTGRVFEAERAFGPHAGSEVHKILPTEEELKPCKDEQDLRTFGLLRLTTR